jgi:hypothetical protein
MQLMVHQRKIVEELGNGKILYGEVGTGKSVAVGAYYVAKEAPKDIFVITTAKKRDSLEWLRDMAKFGIGTSIDSTVAGVLVVDSWNNIGKYVGVEDAFFVFDEQRLVGTGSWVKSFLKIARKNRWVLLTATPGDTWMDYAPVFVANNLYDNITQFKREHVVYAPYVKYPKIIRYLGTDTLEKYRNMILVDMEYIKHTHRNVEWLELDYDLDLFQKVYRGRWNVFENRPIRDVSELFRVMRKVVNSDFSRIDKLRELMKTHPRIIVFYNFNYELEMLRGLSNETTLAEWNGHKKQSVPSTESWIYLVQYASGAEGWNCTATNSVVFFSLTYSYKNFHQAQGRIDRLNTPFVELYYYVFYSKSLIDLAVKKSLENKKMFNQREFERKLLKN